MPTTLANYKDDKYYRKIVLAVSKILERQNFVSPITVLSEMSLLREADLKNWKQGRVAYLEKVIQCNLSKANRILRILRFHAHDLNMRPSLTVYRHKQHRLKFSKSGDKNLEEAYSRHFVSPLARKKKGKGSVE